MTKKSTLCISCIHLHKIKYEKTDTTKEFFCLKKTKIITDYVSECADYNNMKLKAWIP